METNSASHVFFDLWSIIAFWQAKKTRHVILYNLRERSDANLPFWWSYGNFSPRLLTFRGLDFLDEYVLERMHQLILSISIWVEDAHASRARGAHARNTLFTDLYSTLRRTLHHSGGRRSFDILVFLVCEGRSHASAFFYRTRKAQKVRDLCLVFWAPSWAPLIHIKSDSSKYPAPILNLVQNCNHELQ